MIKFKEHLRPVLKRNETLHAVWSQISARRLEDRFRNLREYYDHRAVAGDINYSPSETIRRARQRVASLPRFVRRNSASKPIHTGIMVLTDNWGLGMIQELEQLGPVTVFDWTKHGFPVSMQGSPALLPEMNAAFLRTLRQADEDCELDWVFIPCSGDQILVNTIGAIRREFGVPIVNQWLDCKQNFEGGIGLYHQDTGQKDIAREFDLVWTSSRVTCEWYLVEHALPIYMPEGFSPQLTPRLRLPKRFDVGFLGAGYERRGRAITALRNAGLSVDARGDGWQNSRGPVPLEGMGEFFAQSKVCLGMGGVGYSEDLRTLKGRDFEVPGAGGCYLTSFNSDLSDCFSIGNEIACYSSTDEMVELARRLVRDDTLRESIAENAWQRSMAEHRWLHRFRLILEILGILKSDGFDSYGYSRWACDIPAPSERTGRITSAAPPESNT